MNDSGQTQEIVDALAGRLALALRATASDFRNCDPDAPAVLEAIARYLDNPDDARLQLRFRREVEKRSRYIR